MTIEDLKAQGCIIYEHISGSRSYGLALPHSDTDIKGVFILPREQFFGLEYIPQISNESNDIVYYELGRFIELLCKSNPNLLEMLFVEEEYLLYKHPIFDKIPRDIFVSKQCKFTFAHYAMTQVKKSRGLHKKILNPMEKERKPIEEFCYILEGQRSIKLSKWLELNNYESEACGLVNIPHAKGTYAVFYDKSGDLDYKGIASPASNNVLLSSVPKEEKALAYMHFNKDGYTKYCKDHRDYWHWVEKRNDQRYLHTLEDGKNYDAKNLMHAFRLLDMAEDVVSQGRIVVKRPNREALLKIRHGHYTYEELMQKAESQISRIEARFGNSSLPEQPNTKQAEKILVEMREAWYSI